MHCFQSAETLPHPPRSTTFHVLGGNPSKPPQRSSISKVQDPSPETSLSTCWSSSRPKLSKCKNPSTPAKKHHFLRAGQSEPPQKGIVFQSAETLSHPLQKHHIFTCWSANPRREAAFSKRSSNPTEKQYFQSAGTVAQKHHFLLAGQAAAPNFQSVRTLVHPPRSITFCMLGQSQRP
jgi:hypothetical protein